MIANNYFGVGFLRGLNSVAEVFAPYSSETDPAVMHQIVTVTGSTPGTTPSGNAVDCSAAFPSFSSINPQVPI